MDMVNDGKDIHLDTPQAVKEALASGKDLYNPQTGEFWWEYNYTGSIANTYVHLDDPNLLAVIDNPDFDLYEDIVGGLNYTGYITDSIETIIEDGEENAPLIDPRDEVFAQIASEDGWVIASPENVRKAVQSHMAEHGGEAPGKENGMDKTAEIAAWKENHVPIDRNGDDALVMHKMADGSREFIVAHGYDEETGHWGHGTYYDSLASAAADLEGRAISRAGEEVICPDFWYRADIESALENAGVEVNDANVNATIKELGLDGDWFNSHFHDRLAEMGQQPEKIAVAAGYRFNLVDTREASGIDLKGCGTVVTVDGHDYEIMKGATYEDSRKVDDLLDSHGDEPISDYRKRPQGMSLKQAVREAREASAKLAEENGGTDDPDGKDER